MCQGPEWTIKEEWFDEEMDIEMQVQGLEDVLICFDPELDEDEQHELDELVNWMNERNMFEEQWLSLETVLKCYKMIGFIKDCAINKISHGYVI
jgi:hypothetical protein